MSKRALDQGAISGSDRSDASDAAEARTRELRYQDAEGHRRILDALGVEIDNEEDFYSDFDVSPGGEIQGQKWPPQRTFLFVVGFNAIAWLAVIAALFLIV